MKARFSIIAIILTFLINASLLRGQEAPASIAGDSVMLDYANRGVVAFTLLVADATGSNYTMVPVLNSSFTGSGTVSYTNTSPGSCVLALTDLSQGQNEQFDLTWGGSEETGLFAYDNFTQSNTSSGQFWMVDGTAPASLAGQTLSCSIRVGYGPFANLGSFNVYYSGSGTSYIILNTSPGLYLNTPLGAPETDSTGSSSFMAENRSTVSAQVSDSVIGAEIEYLLFTNSSSGLMFITTTNITTGYNYQLNNFTVTNLLPPFFAASVPVTNNWYGWNSWYYLNMGSSSPYGYFNYSYLPYIYHYDLGWEYYMDAGNATGGAYFYDFTDSAWYYTDTNTFPFLYDFHANAWMWYAQETGTSNHYTSNPRWFYNFSTTNWVNNL